LNFDQIIILKASYLTIGGTQKLLVELVRMKIDIGLKQNDNWQSSAIQTLKRRNLVANRTFIPYVMVGERLGYNFLQIQTINTKELI